ncbi:MAG: hypothetical protein OEO21_05730 [Candidatus Krumholzibacteria bacterium]|nr:hypothetical protein [Candidatus Krumholzibacteria bacterium]
MKRKRVWIFSAIAAVAAWGLQSHAPAGHSAAGEPRGPAASGMVVHIDPATGEFVEPRDGTVPVALDKEMLDALSTSAEGLVETPSPVPGGGVMVDLRGRFHSTHVAVVDGEGGLSATCHSGEPHAHAEGERCAATAGASSEEVQP